MQALMLAAGMGRRLGKYTDNQTKCMVQVGGKTLLEHCIDALIVAKIPKLVMVIGYESQRLKDFIKEKQFPIEIELILNEDYGSTNNIYSLYLAQTSLMEDDTILLESDLIYDVDTIKKVVKDENANAVVVAKYLHWMDGTVTLLDDYGNIKEFIEKKDFNYKNVTNYYKTVNIYKFSKEFSKKQYIPFLEAYIKVYGKNQYYELVLKAIAHLSNACLKAIILDENVKWYEIDDGQDLDVANTLFSSEENILHQYEYHYGGYWRFDQLKDFCYLVNPYFPPQKMLDHMKFFFDTLISEYPSGMTIQQLISSKMFGIDEDYILVGNGAAELISAIGQLTTGKMALTIPAFNEYIRCFPHCTFEKHDSIQDDFQLNKQFFMNACHSCDVITIINPDNPSGSFLSEEDLMDILNEAKKTNTFCIIDESFIDFAEKNIRYTLLSDEILEKYPNLLVIKSISKSYGVPGIRLGILASSDKNRLIALRELLPVWNINSFAEYFLQIYGVYSQDYVTACDKIAECRLDFVENLKKISFLTVYPSQANYIMCEVTAKYDARELATILLTKNNLLLKELSSKDGFQKREYIRIAVKSKEDNDAMLRCLQSLEE